MNNTNPDPQPRVTAAAGDLDSILLDVALVVAGGVVITVRLQRRQRWASR